jgi:hypothetical protein
MFQIWTRSNNQGEWTLYGEFKSEREFRAEWSNIEFLGLYTKRVRVGQ